MCITLYASLAYFCGTKAYLLTALTYMLYSGRPSPSLLSPKSFRKVRRLLASFVPQENTEKRAQTVKMTKQCLGWCFTHTCHENDFGLTLMANMNHREKGLDFPTETALHF